MAVSAIVYSGSAAIDPSAGIASAAMRRFSWRASWGISAYFPGGGTILSISASSSGDGIHLM
jgi:hypothetical protein